MEPFPILIPPLSWNEHPVLKNTFFPIRGEIIGGSIKLEEDEIVDYKWIQLSELINIENEVLRNADVNKQIINNLLHNNFYSISIFNKQLVN